MLKQILLLNRNVKRVLLVQWLTSIGYFTVIPYFAYYLSNHLHFSVPFVGVQMTLLLAGQYVMTIAGGILGDKMGAAKIMLCGLLLQIACYFLLALDPRSGWEISLLTLGIGIGKSLYTPSAKKLALEQAGGGDRVFLFSLRSTVNNVGVALGSLIGALSIKVSPPLFFALAGAVQIGALAFLFPFLLEKKISVATPAGKTGSVFDNLRELLYANKFFCSLALLYFGFQALYIQLEFTFPLEAAKRFSEIGISTIFLTNSLVVIALQIPLNVALAKRMAPSSMLFCGYALMSFAFMLMLAQSGMPPFVVAIAAFTIGEIVIDPNIDALVGTTVPSGMSGSAFGILGFFALLGGTLGNTAGALLFEHGANYLWMAASGLAGLLACGVLFLPRGPQELVGESIN